MIEIVAVSYYGSSDVVGLVRSLENQSNRDWRLTVVDNTGDARELKLLTSAVAGSPRCRVIVSGENRGYLGGARVALHDVGAVVDADWTVICNTDIEFDDPQSLERLANVKGPDVGVVAPAIRSSLTGENQNPFMASRPSRLSLKCIQWQLATPLLAQTTHIRSYLLRKLRRKKPVDISEPREIYAGHGSVFALSREYFRRGGDLEHPLFLFGEELYVAEQCRRYGLTELYVPAWRVTHAAHKQTGLWRSAPVLKAMVESGRFGVDLLYGDDKELNRD